MKTLLKSKLTIALLAVMHCVNGQVDVLPTGEVGIGNLNPQYELDVNGSINVTDSIYVNGVPFSPEGGAGIWTGDEEEANFMGNVGIGTTSPKAALHINSSTGGFLPPRMSAYQRGVINQPEIGTMVFDTDEGCLALYDGVDWGCLSFTKIAFADDDNDGISNTEDACPNWMRMVSKLRI